MKEMYRRTTDDNTYQRSTEGMKRYTTVLLMIKEIYRRTTDDSTYQRSTEGIEEKYIDVPLTMKITKYTNVPLKVNYQRPTGGRKRSIAVPLTITHTNVPLKALKRNTSTYH